MYYKIINKNKQQKYHQNASIQKATKIFFLYETSSRK